MKVKSQKGSIALFVLIALLFYMGFLLLLYANNLNKIQTIAEKTDILKGIYERNIDNINDVYNRIVAKQDNQKPIINMPSTLVVNLEALDDEEYLREETYVTYGKLGGETEYLAFNNKFITFKEVVNYAVKNSKYGECNLKINAYGNNNLKSTKEINIDITWDITSGLIADKSMYVIQNSYITDTGVIRNTPNFNIYFLKIPQDYTSLKLQTSETLIGASNTYIGYATNFNEIAEVIVKSYSNMIEISNINTEYEYIAISIRKAGGFDATLNTTFEFIKEGR